jgi:hypothetical protein
VSASIDILDPKKRKRVAFRGKSVDHFLGSKMRELQSIVNQTLDIRWLNAIFSPPTVKYTGHVKRTTISVTGATTENAARTS